MFKTNFSGHNKIWGGNAPECPSVVTRLDRPSERFSIPSNTLMVRDSLPNAV